MTRSDINVWRLTVGGRKYLGLIPHDLSYFNANFNGAHISLPWEPPPVEIDGKSKKLPDFVSWMKCVPVVSDRAKLVLEQVAKDQIQFLPFHDIKGKKYYALNVVNIEHHVLDKAKSSIFFASTGAAISLDKAVFINPLPSNLPPIFKVEADGEIFGDIFVSRIFADIAIQHQFTGIALADPKLDPLDELLSNRPANVVPGIAE